MIRSMTGYGEAERELPGGTLRAVVKTVNHRFFNANLRMAPYFDRHEADFQRWLKAHFSRGHVNLTLVFDRDTNAVQDLPELDLERARHYRDLLEQLRTEIGAKGKPELSAFLTFGDLFRNPQRGAGEPVVEASLLKELVDEASDAAVGMRTAEGRALEQDLRTRLDLMEDRLTVIEDRAPERLVRERDRLRASIGELAGQELDEDRLAKEVAYLAERWDIHEEIVRFKSHLRAFRETLDESAETPSGKRLGFLVQEMHREVNTIASKANDVEIGHASVDVREEIERLREQLENVE